jgi:hypothetical protein
MVKTQIKAAFEYEIFCTYGTHNMGECDLKEQL